MDQKPTFRPESIVHFFQARVASELVLAVTGFGAVALHRNVYVRVGPQGGPIRPDPRQSEVARR